MSSEEIDKLHTLIGAVLLQEKRDTLTDQEGNRWSLREIMGEEPDPAPVLARALQEALDDVRKLVVESDEARRIARELYENYGTFDLCSPEPPDWLLGKVKP